MISAKSGFFFVFLLMQEPCRWFSELYTAFSAHPALLLEFCCSISALRGLTLDVNTTEQEPQLGSGSCRAAVTDVPAQWELQWCIGIISVTQISQVQAGIYYSLALAAHCNIYFLHFWKKCQVSLAMLPGDDSEWETGTAFGPKSNIHQNNLLLLVYLSKVSAILLSENYSGFFSLITS